MSCIEAAFILFRAGEESESRASLSAFHDHLLGCAFCRELAVRRDELGIFDAGVGPERQDAHPVSGGQAGDFRS